MNLKMFLGIMMAVYLALILHDLGRTAARAVLLLLN